MAVKDRAKFSKKKGEIECLENSQLSTTTELLSGLKWCTYVLRIQVIWFLSQGAQK